MWYKVAVTTSCPKVYLKAEHNKIVFEHKGQFLYIAVLLFFLWLFVRERKIETDKERETNITFAVARVSAASSGTGTPGVSPVKTHWQEWGVVTWSVSALWNNYQIICC